MITAIAGAARTHVGLVRRRNEDAYYLGTYLAAVADGMGGHVAGNVASNTVIDAIKAFDRHVDSSHVAAALGQAVHAGSLALQRRIAAEPGIAGMGTTLVAVMWSGDQLVLANIGDSRAYLLRGGLLTQLTEDHVYARMLANADRVPVLPEKLSRFLDGRLDGRSPDLAPIGVRSGDRLLLCSDGLSSYVPADVIQGALAPSVVDRAVDALVTAALDRGAPDNVTVAVLDL